MEIEDTEPKQSKPIQAEVTTPVQSAKPARSSFWDSLQDGVAKAIGSNLVYVPLIALLWVAISIFHSMCSLPVISASCKGSEYDTYSAAAVGSSTPDKQVVTQTGEKPIPPRTPSLTRSTRLKVAPTVDQPGRERFVADRLSNELNNLGYSHVGDLPVELSIEIQKVDVRSRPTTATLWQATATVSVIIRWTDHNPTRVRPVSVDSEGQEEDSARTEALNNLIQKVASDLAEIVLSYS